MEPAKDRRTLLYVTTVNGFTNVYHNTSEVEGGALTEQEKLAINHYLYPIELVVGKRYVVRASHHFHGGKAGLFEFMGGATEDVVVLCTEQSNSGKHLIAVHWSDIERQED